MSGINGINNNINHYGRIASGKRINSAKDDASGLAIAQKLERETRALEAARENANTGVNMANVADGAMAGVTDYLQDISAMSVRAMNGLYSSSDRQAMQSEVNGYMNGIDQLARGTQFNSQTLLDGNTASINIASSPNGSGSTVQMADSTVSGLGVIGFDVTRNFNSSTIDNALNAVSSARADLGASTNGLERSARYSAMAAEQQTASKSRLEDLDIGKAVSDKKKDESLQNYRIMMQKKQMENGSFINKLFT